MTTQSAGNPIVGFIGAGNMATSLIKGMIAQGHPGASIWASDLDNQKLSDLKLNNGISIGSTAELLAQCDVVVLSVKPQVMQAVCKEIAPLLVGGGKLVISIAAGITVQHLTAWLGVGIPIVRCMPNTPALVNKGASGLFATSDVSDAFKQTTEGLFNAVGICVWVAKEADIDSVIAVSGSGPAYFFLFMEAMQETAMSMGLSEEVARALTYQTAVGAAELAQTSPDSSTELRRKVTSPGGTTEQAILAFESGGLRELVNRAMESAQTRSVELAEELGKS